MEVQGSRAGLGVPGARSGMHVSRRDSGPGQAVGHEAEAPVDRPEADAAFRGFFRSLAVGGVQISPDGRFVEVNDRFCTLTGYERSALLGMRVGQLDHPDDQPADQERWAAFLRDPSVGYDVEKRYVRRDGSVISVHVTAARIVTGTNRTLIAKTVEDITDRVEAERTLRESEERLRAALAVKEDFLGLVSHELRTPLTVIVGMASLMARPDARPEFMRDTALEIRESAEHLMSLLESMLVLARTDRSEDFSLEPLTLTRVVARAVERHREVHPHRRVSFESRNEQALVDGHEPWITQIVANLLGNAEKYSPSDGEIRVLLDRDGASVAVRVLDEGIGLPDPEAARVFEPFYRSHRAEARSGGLGLGLAVCKRLVDLQGGTIWAASRPSGGSEFGFSLPALGETRETVTRG